MRVKPSAPAEDAVVPLAGRESKRRRVSAKKRLLVPIVLFAALTLALTLALLAGHEAEAVSLLNNVRRSALVSRLADPFSLLDQRSPGGRAGPLQQTKPPHERVLAQVRDRDPPADTLADAPGDDLAGGGPGFAVGPGELPPNTPSSSGSPSASGSSGASGSPLAPTAFGAGAPGAGSLIGAPAGGSGSGGNAGTGGGGSNPPSGDQPAGNQPPGNQTSNVPPPGGNIPPSLTNFDTPPGDTNPGNIFTPPPGAGDNAGPPGEGPPGGGLPTTPGGTPGGAPPVTVPEPASWMLLMGGILAGIAGARRRRRGKRR